MIAKPRPTSLALVPIAILGQPPGNRLHGYIFRQLAGPFTKDTRYDANFSTTARKFSGGVYFHEQGSDHENTTKQVV